jgi:8-oxo-dGTP diphosphatase
MAESNKLNKERFKIIGSVYIMPIKSSQILLSRRFNTGYQDGNYSMVAGHLEKGETVTEGVVREALEEANIKIDLKNLEYALTLYRADCERIDLFFMTAKWQGEIKNMEPERCSDLKWFPLDDLPENTIPYIRKAIDCYKEGIKYYDYLLKD